MELLFENRSHGRRSLDKYFIREIGSYQGHFLSEFIDAVMQDKVEESAPKRFSRENVQETA